MLCAAAFCTEGKFHTMELIVNVLSSHFSTQLKDSLELVFSLRILSKCGRLEGLLVYSGYAVL